MKQNSESENQASYDWKWSSSLSSSWKFSAKSEDIVSVRKSAKFVLVNEVGFERGLASPRVFQLQIQNFAHAKIIEVPLLLVVPTLVWSSLE